MIGMSGERTHLACIVRHLADVPTEFCWRQDAPDSTRWRRALPRVHPNSYSCLARKASPHVQTNSFQRNAHWHRRRRNFDVTLVVWSENARQKYFEDCAAVAE